MGLRRTVDTCQRYPLTVKETDDRPLLLRLWLRRNRCGSSKSTANYATYGVLYNWPAVMTEGICPSGWHIPSDGEWQTMEISLGMSESEAAQTGWRGSPVGDYMKSTSGWNSGGNGSNSSGFTGLPGGYRYSGGFAQWILRVLVVCFRVRFLLMGRD